MVDTVVEGRPVLRTADEIAQYLGISMPTIYRLLRSRKLKGTKVGGQWRIPDDAIRAFLEEGIQVPIAKEREK
jgi:excisionase family DNA binding protein